MDAALLFLGTTLFGQVLAVAAAYEGENVAWRATNALRFDLTSHCLGLDQSFHKEHTPGELIERIDGDVAILSGFFSEFLITVLGNATLLVGVLALVFLEDWRMGFALSLLVLFALLVLTSLRSVAVEYWIRMREMSGLFFGFLGELFAGVEDVRANGAQGYVMRRFYKIRRQWLSAKLKGVLRSNASWMVKASIFRLSDLAIFVARGGSHRRYYLSVSALLRAAAGPGWEHPRPGAGASTGRCQHPSRSRAAAHSIQGGGGRRRAAARPPAGHLPRRFIRV